MHQPMRGGETPSGPRASPWTKSKGMGGSFPLGQQPKPQGWLELRPLKGLHLKGDPYDSQPQGMSGICLHRKGDPYDFSHKG